MACPLVAEPGGGWLHCPTPRVHPARGKGKRPTRGTKACPVKGCNQVLHIDSAPPVGPPVPFPCGHFTLEKKDPAKTGWAAYQASCPGCNHSRMLSSHAWRDHWRSDAWCQTCAPRARMGLPPPEPTPGGIHGPETPAWSGQISLVHVSSPDHVDTDNIGIDLDSIGNLFETDAPAAAAAAALATWTESALTVSTHAVLSLHQDSGVQDMSSSLVYGQLDAMLSGEGPAIAAPTIGSLSPQDAQMSLHTTGNIRLWKAHGVAQPFHLDLAHSSIAQLPVMVDRGAGNPVKSITVGSTLNQELQFRRISPPPLGCPKDKDLLMILFEAPPVQPLGAEASVQDVLLELESSPGILQQGWQVWHRDTDKALEEQGTEIAELKAELCLRTSRNTVSHDPSSRRPADDKTDNSKKQRDGSPGDHCLSEQQASQDMQDTACRALDTYSELMVEHPFQTLKWVESCVESLALLCAGQPQADRLNEELRQALAHLHQNLSDAPKALVLRDAVHTARQRCAFFKRECPEDEALHRQMDQELAQARGRARFQRITLWGSNLLQSGPAKQEVICPPGEETSDSERSLPRRLKLKRFTVSLVPQSTESRDKVMASGDFGSFLPPLPAILDQAWFTPRRSRALKHASEELRADREVVLAAVQRDGRALEHASEELRADREVVLAAVQQSGWALQHASEELRADREVVLAAVQRNAFALQRASEELRADREVVLAALQQDGWALQHASEELRADREVVLAAVQQNAFALEHASEELRADREFMLAAVQRNGRALEFASEELRADREFMLAAVQRNGRALQHASEELRADREVVLVAVQQDGFALQHASKELRADREFMLWNGGPGGHHMKAQQTSQHMQDTACRALDTYSELMVEHPFQTLKWVESCVESLAVLGRWSPKAPEGWGRQLFLAVGVNSNDTLHYTHNDATAMAEMLEQAGYEEDLEGEAALGLYSAPSNELSRAGVVILDSCGNTLSSAEDLAGFGMGLLRSLTNYLQVVAAAVHWTPQSDEESLKLIQKHLDGSTLRSSAQQHAILLQVLGCSIGIKDYHHMSAPSNLASIVEAFCRAVTCHRAWEVHEQRAALGWSSPMPAPDRRTFMLALCPGGAFAVGAVSASPPIEGSPVDVYVEDSTSGCEGEEEPSDE